jgi:hypothetical protein
MEKSQAKSYGAIVLSEEDQTNSAIRDVVCADYVFVCANDALARSTTASGANAIPDIRTLCWFSRVSVVPRRYLRALAEDAMANVVRDPPEHSEVIIPDLKSNTVKPFTLDDVGLVYGSNLEGTLFHKNRRRLLSAALTVGHHQPRLACLPRPQ